MSLVKDIAEFLQAQSYGTVATNIFYANAPAQPDSLVCCYEYAGLPPLVNESLDQPGLQIFVRGTSYETVRGILQNIQGTLMRIGNPEDTTYFDGITLNSTKYLRIYPAQGIVPLGRDELDRTEMVQNFYIVKER